MDKDCNMADEIEQKPSKTRADKRPVDDGLVAMTKGGSDLRVHPNHVGEHAELGWVKASE